MLPFETIVATNRIRNMTILINLTGNYVVFRYRDKTGKINRKYCSS